MKRRMLKFDLELSEKIGEFHGFGIRALGKFLN